MRPTMRHLNSHHRSHANAETQEAQAGDSGRDALFVSATWQAALAHVGAAGGQQPAGVTCVKEAKGTGPRKLDKVCLWIP
jgi:hypothetical protein